MSILIKIFFPVLLAIVFVENYNYAIKQNARQKLGTFAAAFQFC